MNYDAIVVGGGPAGLAGAVPLARARRSVLVVDAGEPRNAAAGHVHNFLTRDGTPRRSCWPWAATRPAATARRSSTAASRPWRAPRGSTIAAERLPFASVGSPLEITGAASPWHALAALHAYLAAQVARPRR